MSPKNDLKSLENAERNPDAASNFISTIVAEDLQTGRRDTVVTRFPPEPNGYAHIGHAQSIWLNFGLAKEYGGVCHLRFDDTNPETENIEYVESFKRDIRWLGFDWRDKEFYASDYFEQLYDWAVVLLKKGNAYVDSLDEDAIREYRGTVTEPGRESPYRHRSVEENLSLFEQMRDGVFEDGAHVLRAKIDMASPNMLLRDPLMYRIRHAHHYRRGDAWRLYPLYDWAHGQSDAIENITHSICTLEFEVHRALYDWFLEALDLDPRPRQYEFARLNPTYTITSKRKLLQLVQEGLVAGWDDPRLPTVAGLRRRGVTPEAIHDFCRRSGITKVNSSVDIGVLDYSIRDDLNHKAPRVMCVLRPLKVTLTNYPEDQVEPLEASYWPHDVPREGSRTVPFSRTLYIDRDDFMEDPPKSFYRLAPGREVRLRYAYIIKCEEVVKDKQGEVIELRCTFHPETKSGGSEAKRRVKGTIHWVSAAHAIRAEVRLYDRLFGVENPDEGRGFKANLNPESMVVRKDSRIEPSVRDDAPGTRYQFERQGYFWPDPEDSSPDALVFNRIVPLRDTWAKITGKKDTNGAKEKTSNAASTTETTPRPTARVQEKRNPLADLDPAQKERFAHYDDELGLPEEDALLLVDDLELAAFFEDALAVHHDPQTVANWVIHELRREIKDTPLDGLPFDGAAFGRLIALIDDGTISGRIAKDVFAEMMARGGDPAEIVARQGLTQLTDPDAVTPIIDGLLAEYPDKVAQYKGGKTGLLGFFVGQVMRATDGKANPQLVQSLVRDKLG